MDIAARWRALRARPEPRHPEPDRDIAALYLRWTFLRSVFHRGWWLCTSLYLVVVADLSASQLLFYGAVLALTMLIAEIPTGVMADTISRKWSLVLAHLVMASGMLMMGFVTAFPLILVTQVLWGLGWTFSTGADVAWLTDELNRRDRTARVLMAAARWEQVGAACGLVGFGTLAWATDLATAIAMAGTGMILLGAFVAARFSERNFIPTRDHRWRESLSILRRGLALARTDHSIRVVFAATFLVNAGGEAYEFLYAKRLLELGFPAQPDPIVWLTALGLAALAVGALALRIVEARIDGVGVARRVYTAACLVGALGVIALGYAPSDVPAMAGVLLVSGIAWPLTRTVGVIWVNRRTSNDVRATVQSLLAQAEGFGELTAGILLGLLAQATSISPVLACSSALLALASVLVFRSRSDREHEAENVIH